MKPASSAHRPSVGVVIPCYNYGRYLPECVQSVVEQEGVDVHALIIDDASPDGSAQVAQALAAADNRVEVRAHAVNQGHIRTYNEGLQWVTGTYTVLLSADDMLTAGSLQRACALLDAHPEVGFVYGRCTIFRDDRPRPAAPTGPAAWTIWPGQEWLARRCHAAENCIHCPEVVIRTSLLRRLGGYDAELPHTADFELWMRLAAHGDVGYIRGPHQAYYRDHAAGMHHERFGTALAELAQYAAAFEIFFRNQGETIADRARLETAARRMLAKRTLLAACRAYDRGAPPLAAVAGLEQLALTTDASAGASPEMRGLRWRKRLGPQASRLLWPLLPPFVVTRLVRRARRQCLYRRGV